MSKEDDFTAAKAICNETGGRYWNCRTTDKACLYRDW